MFVSFSVMITMYVAGLLMINFAFIDPGIGMCCICCSCYNL